MNKDKNQICVNKGVLFILLAVLVVGFAVLASQTNLLSSFSQAAIRRNLVGVDTACDNNSTSGYYKSTYNANTSNGSTEYCFKYTIIAATGSNPKFCSRGAPVKMDFCNATPVTQLSQADILAKNSYCASIKGKVGRITLDSRGKMYCQKFNGNTYAPVDLTTGKRVTTTNPQVTPALDGTTADAAYCNLDNKLYWDAQCTPAAASTTSAIADRPRLLAKCQLYKGVVGRIDPNRDVVQQFSGDVNYLAINPNVTESYGDNNLKYCKLDTSNISFDKAGIVSNQYYIKNNTDGTLPCEGLGIKQFFNSRACRLYVSQHRATLFPNSATCYGGPECRP